MAVAAAVKVLALLLCMLIPAHAEEARRPVFLDGVEMALIKSNDGNGVEIIYGQDVPPALREMGVTTGTMLVRGQWEENILIGEAYAFSKDCGPISYAIRGVVDYGGSLLVFGPVPTTCKPDDYANYSWGKGMIMRFDQPQMAAVKQERERKGKKTRRAEQPKPKEQAKRQPAPSASRVARPRPPPAPRQQQQQQQQYWPSYPQWWR